MEGNVFLGGAIPSKNEKCPIVELEENPMIDLVKEPESVYLRITPKKSWTVNRSIRIITTKLLGKAQVPGQGFTNPDDTPLTIDTDYFGARRTTDYLIPGPFARLESGKFELKVWPLPDRSRNVQ
jgi:hypothetical protein